MKPGWVFRLIFPLCLTACASLSTAVPAPHPKIIEKRAYAVRQTLSLTNLGAGTPEKQNLWVALIRDIPPYQSAELKAINPGDYQTMTDELGNTYAEFDFSEHPPGEKITVEIEYRVTVNELLFETDLCQGELPQEFTLPELHIESANPQIVALSHELSRGKDTACEQARAFYDYVGDELVYTYNRRAWGAQSALGNMGADCSEYASLMMALSRAAGIPTRYYEGLLYLENKNNGVAQIEHAWLDVYLPGAGWAAVDPTLGRTPLYRESHFAHYTPDHIIITVGRNPSTLRGSSYWSHLYWPGDSTKIIIEEAEWSIEALEP